ncbi:MAG: outer membrane protein [Xanthobacteraceae bacterium]
MKKLLLSSSVLVALGVAGSAMAADLPVYTKAPPPPPGYDWSGLYVGGHIGGGWGSNDFSDPGLGVVGTLLGVPVVQTTKSSGFLGGVQGGYNYQIGRLVIGAEADFSWAGIDGTNATTFSPAFFPLSVTRSLTANTDWTGSATTRIGVAHDRVLFYAKAGAAWAHTNYTDNWAAFGIPVFTGTGSETRVGWTVGTGVEWAVWNNWSAKLEYDYMNFGNQTTTIAGTVLPGIVSFPASFGVQNYQQVSELKFGINYKFMPGFW